MSCRFAAAALDPIFENADFGFPDGIVTVSTPDHLATTHLLECLAGLRPLQQGHYWWDDADIYRLDARAALQRRRAIGCAFDHRGLLFGISLFENLQLPLLYHRHLDEAAADRRAREYLERVGLSAQSELRPGQITAAQRKLCVLARSLITHPELLVWDEPTTGLLREYGSLLAEWLHQHAREHRLRQVFVATEDSGFRQKLGGTTITLADRRWQGGSR